MNAVLSGNGLLLIGLVIVPTLLTLLWAIGNAIWRKCQKRSGKDFLVRKISPLRYDLFLLLATAMFGILLYSLARLALGFVPAAQIDLAFAALIGFAFTWAVAWTYLGAFGCAMVYDAYELYKRSKIDSKTKWSIIRQFVSVMGLSLVIGVVGGVLASGVQSLFSISGRAQSNNIQILHGANRER